LALQVKAAVIDHHLAMMSVDRIQEGTS